MAECQLTRLLIIPLFGILFVAIKKNLIGKSTKMVDNCLNVHLRHDQKIGEVGCEQFQDDQVSIYGFHWTKTLLDKLGERLPSEIDLSVHDNQSNNTILMKMTKPLLFKDLVVLARNECKNINGAIAFEQYPAHLDRGTILSIKDLVRQLVIVGEVETKFYGGYPRKHIVKQEAKVILVDLIGLQFQLSYNSGRLVLVGEDLPKGDLDDLLFECVVGESKASFEQAQSDGSSRYQLIDQVYFDRKAYQMFVANDFLLVCIAVNHFAKEKVNLKFLRYGCGYFGGRYRQVLGENIVQGIVLGLKKYVELGVNKNIQSFEFPFYEECSDLVDICRSHGFKCRFSREDALKRSDPSVMDATTNCADPHVITGNEMGFTSVDAAIAQNLKDHAYRFSPIINQLMLAHIIGPNASIHNELDCPDQNKSNL